MMFRRTFKLLSLALTGVLASSVVLAEPPRPATDQPATGQVAQGETAWNRKLTKALPKNRTGGSNTQKAAGVSEASLFFIAPKTTGLTTRELPDVYWYISEPSKSVTFTLLRADRKNKTELRLEIKNVQPGFHKIELAREARLQKFAGLEANDWAPADNAAAPELKVLYRMALKSEEPKMLATAYVARVQAPAGGGNPSDFGLQIKNELWYDAVQSLAGQLSTEQARKPAPRKQFSQLLAAEEVLRSELSENASDEDKKKARQEEEKVFEKLSVPDPIDIQSDKWEAKSVPDPIDLN